MAQQSAYVMNKRTGVVFVATTILRGIDDMEPCNMDGTPFLAFVEELDSANEPEPGPVAADTDPVLNKDVVADVVPPAMDEQ